MPLKSSIAHFLVWVGLVALLCALALTFASKWWYLLVLYVVGAFVFLVWHFETTERNRLKRRGL